MYLELFLYTEVIELVKRRKQSIFVHSVARFAKLVLHIGQDSGSQSMRPVGCMLCVYIIIYTPVSWLGKPLAHHR